MAVCWARRGARLLDEEEGPRTRDERQCTDTLCLLAFLVTLGLVALVGGAGASMGDIASVAFGKDHLGRRCGVGELAHLRKVFYPRLGGELLVQSDLIRQPWRLQLFGICTATCPQRGDPPIRDFSGDDAEWPVVVSTVDVLNRCVPTAEEVTHKTVACAFPRCEHVPFSGVHCLSLPGHEGEGLWAMESTLHISYCQRQLTLVRHERYEVPFSGALVESILTMASSVTAAFDEIARAHLEVLVCGVVLAVLLGIAWLMSLRFFSGFAVWLSLVGTAVLLVATTFFCAFKANLLVFGAEEQTSSHEMSHTELAPGFFQQLLASEQQSDRNAFAWAMVALSLVIATLNPTFASHIRPCWCYSLA